MAHAGGRPTEYKVEYVQKVDEYLAIQHDEERQILKQVNSEKGYEMYENKLKVNLPTIEGLATFLGVTKPTLYDWAELYLEFSYAFDKVKREQHDRLVNSGLSGDYNSTIAKLMLSSNHGYKEREDKTSDDKPLTFQIVNFKDTVPLFPKELSAGISSESGTIQGSDLESPRG